MSIALEAALDELTVAAMDRIGAYSNGRRIDAAKEQLRKMFSEATYSPSGDNHHNALHCPYCNPKRIGVEPQYNLILKEEAEDLRFFLDDADMLFTAPGRGTADRMLALWRRLHLWLLAEQGDRDAAMLLRREFPPTKEQLAGATI